MAEGVLFNVAGQIMKKLSSHASQEFGMLCGLEDDFTKLTSSVLSIKAVLRDAEERQIKSHSVKDWLEKLKEALYDADDVLDEFSCESLRREVMTRGKNTNQVSIFFSKFNHVAFDLKMAHKIKHVRERLDVIAVEKYKFHFVENLEQKTQHDDELTTRSVETYSFSNEELIGREDDKKAIKDLLLDMNVKDNVSFIAIVGIGGIGKTTLAKSLYNDSEILESFELKMWVCISDEFDVKIVVGKIIEAATKSSPSVRGMESLQSQLQKVIQGKKYLLVMDDIWNESEEKWFHLKNLLMGGARGSKIMITKRDSILAAEIANMTSLLTLKGLSESHSWSLFRKVAFKEGKEPINLNMRQLGKEILVKCKGVPIVIRHIGRLLHGKTSEEWISFQSNELLEVIQRDHNMTSMLKLSYNNLPPNLKQCFAYSSLFLKDESINKDQLIQQWVAHGFLESPNGSKSMEDIGNDYLTELCWRFFYEHFHEDIPYEVYMHDLMHDLARMVAGNEYVYGNLKFDYVGQKIRHVSFDHEIKSQWDFLPKLGMVEGLRTFLIPYNPHKRKEINETILDELFSNCSYLRVLDLKCSNIKIVPDSIKKLKHLRYLDLSENEDMELLPNSISELQNLQTLNLTGCYALKELPRVTSNLVNLRHLDVSSIPLTHMPEGMGKLTCLQTLSSFVLNNNNGQGSRLSELNGLNNLRGWLHIKGLEQLRSTPSEASLANLKEKKGLRHLTLEWKLSCDEFKSQAAYNDEIVFDCLEPHPSVEILFISGYSGERLPNWVSNPLRNLTHIIIEKCHGLHHLPQFGHLPSLQHLTLDTMTPLKFIEKNENPYSSSSVFFPSLEYLWFENMPNLEGWWEREPTEGECVQNHGFLPTFPRLSVLSISNCPKLASMPGHPPLKEVTLDGVGLQMMSSITSQLSSLESLKLTQIEDLEYLPWNDPYSSPTSLSDLDIRDCPKLKSLPEGMRLLKLDYLHIAGCPELEERCMEGGEDWSKIAHLPSISISHHLPVEGDEDAIHTDTTHSSQVEVAEGESEIWKKMKDFVINTLSFILNCGRTTHNETNIDCEMDNDNNEFTLCQKVDLPANLQSDDKRQ